MTDQRAILANLARRSQALVDRQLLLLGKMERDERDPDRLASLFELGHLAARMRRNDLNVLVLAGERLREPPGVRSAGAEPRRRRHNVCQIQELALEAVAEIEHYERIQVDVDRQLHLASYAAAEFVHLLSELLENATRFSPPNTPVIVTGHAKAERALVSIVDQGMGLSPGVLAELNGILATPPEVDVETSVRMGLVVVSHIAARHTMRVRLYATHTGTRVAVDIPSVLLDPGISDQGES